MKQLRSKRVDGALALALAIAGLSAHAQTSQPGVQSCGSVVVVHCDRPPTGAVLQPPQHKAAQQARRVEERRRAFNEPLDLDRIIIEAEPMRRPVEEAMAGAFTPLPPYGTYTFSNPDGSQCSCMNRCPPIPLPCCQCAPHPRSYMTSPGSSIVR